MKKIAFLIMLVSTLLVVATTIKVDVTAKEYNTYNKRTNINSVSAIINKFKSSIDNSHLLNTNRFNCIKSGSNLSCSTSSYSLIGLLSLDEYNYMGGNDSFLFNQNSYFVLDGSTVKNLSSGGVNSVTDSRIKATAYVKSDVKVIGNGTPGYPYEIASSICFNTNGGNTIPCKTIIEGATLGTLPIPTKTGKKFDGWYTDSTSGVEVNANTEVNSLTGDTLYARWK